MKFWLFLIGLFLILPTGSVLAAESTTVDPTDDMRCWTKEVCNATDGRFDSSTNKAKEVCSSSAYGDVFGFCYPPAVDYELGVSLPFGSRVETTVSDLGDYIDKTYKFLLGFSAIIAVLMLMVGGLQYVTSPGGEEVAKAKERIIRSLTGLVLLMCAALILFTVNPQLIKLEMPAIPKTRTVFFVSESTSCEILLDHGYTLKNSSGQEVNIVDSSVTKGKCGDELMTIVKDPNGQTIEKTTVCHWMTCDESGKQCLISPEIDKDFCVSCEDIYDKAINKIKPESSTCSRLTPPNSSSANGVPIEYHCFFINDWDVAITQDSCALIKVDCGNITSCNDYEKIEVTSGAGSSKIRSIEQSVLNSDFGIEGLCKDDPCVDQRKDGDTCKFVSGGIGENHCLNSSQELDHDYTDFIPPGG